MKRNPIIIIDDDPDDIALISSALKDLEISNDLFCFEVPQDAINFLTSSDNQPLFILCDINMPQLDGFEVRKILYENEKLKFKSIPFLFLTTSQNHRGINQAYDLCVQGYFVKPNSYAEVLDLLKFILQYWQVSQHPNYKLPA